MSSVLLIVAVIVVLASPNPMTLGRVFFISILLLTVGVIVVLASPNPMTLGHVFFRENTYPVVHCWCHCSLGQSKPNDSMKLFTKRLSCCGGMLISIFDFLPLCSPTPQQLNVAHLESSRARSDTYRLP